jgi:hypothetical protein
MSRRNDNDVDRQSLMSAVVTEHFVLQTAAATTVSEMGTRASLYILALSSALVAMGFAAGSRDVFVPFVATVLPALVLLGVFTVVRLVDALLEYNEYLIDIARIRRFYRSLSPEAAELFAATRGRWPETEATEPSLRLGEFIAFITTTPSMVAFINSIVAGAGVTLLAEYRLGTTQRTQAIGLGIGAAVLLMTAFLLYQRWRFSLPSAAPGSRDELSQERTRAKG